LWAKGKIKKAKRNIHFYETKQTFHHLLSCAGSWRICRYWRCVVYRKTKRSFMTKANTETLKTKTLETGLNSK
jgi:hypothetical protein